MATAVHVQCAIHGSEQGNGPRYNLLARLCLPFIRKETGRKDFGGDLDGDYAVLQVLYSPL